MGRPVIARAASSVSVSERGLPQNSLCRILAARAPRSLARSILVVGRRRCPTEIASAADVAEVEESSSVDTGSAKTLPHSGILLRTLWPRRSLLGLAIVLFMGL